MQDVHMYGGTEMGKLNTVRPSGRGIKNVVQSSETNKPGLGYGV